METILKEINAVVGVIGSFVCLNDASVVARAMPDSIPTAQTDLAARVACQTIQALESSGQPVNDFDLTFEKGRLFFKNLGGGVLAIVCARTINIPLLNLAANAAVKKLAVELQAKPAPVPVAPISTRMATSAVVALPPVLVELEQEIHRIVEDARHYRLRLRAMNQAATWLVCPNYRRLLMPMEKKQIDLGGFLNESDSTEILLGQLGYTIDRHAGAVFGNRRLVFVDAKRDTSVDVFLDNYQMYHRLDLIPFLTQEELLLPITALLLARLQFFDMSESLVRELCALMLQHDLSVGAEKGKIDAAYITRLCADDWGWFKTISINLDRLMTFAGNHLAAADRALAAERAQRLKRSMDGAPKSLRWQTRAALGESAKWYETPPVYRPGSARPDVALW